ncbi:MAG TPA: glutathione S-transferase N-terminal domain-containing protein [Burkholderiales bacterium]|jgi:glutathione S-transferase|nr:glutathione S-transferase N-terminal domain-containing protein [Burkholderiales bacterium]
MIVLWELRGQADRRYSLFSWRTRMALTHKGLPFESRPVCMSDKAAIAFSGGKTVPVIKDGDTVVRDSWAIAEHLENRYPDRPALFGGDIGRGLSHTFNVWVDRAVVPAMLPLVVADIHERIDPADDAFFRQMMEKILKTTLEDTRSTREQSLRRFGTVLAPMQAVLKRQAYVCGAQPAYADYALFSVFQWARVMSPQEVLGPEDPLCAWRERMLDLFGGFARRVPTA